MNGIEAVIFDLGNVLLAYDEGRAAERLAARTGKTRRQIDDYARSTPYVTELALGKLSKRQFFHTVARDLAFEPMIALAESLKTRVPRLLLSNTNAIHIDFVLERYPFLNDFDAHVFSHEVGLLKPDAAIFQHTLGKYGLTAGRTVFLDDIAANAEAARRAGMQAVHYRDFGQARAELTKLGVSPI
jgi:HAD superfamily hydrolase (TIGR01509 family)